MPCDSDASACCHSYQEEDLARLREKWSGALDKRREYLDEQLQKIMNKEGAHAQCGAGREAGRVGDARRGEVEGGGQWNTAVRWVKPGGVGRVGVVRRRGAWGQSSQIGAGSGGVGRVGVARRGEEGGIQGDTAIRCVKARWGGVGWVGGQA